MKCDVRAGLAALAVIAGALWESGVRADQVVIPAVMDNTLIQISDGSLSNGASQWMFAGRTLQGTGSDKRRALIKFDIAAAIPPGSTITAAALTLRMSRTQAGTVPVRVHKMLASWGEGTSAGDGQGGGGEQATTGDATWLYRFWPGTPWTVQGGQYVAASSALTLVGGISSYNWSGFGMVTDVQSWVDDPSTNFGWILVGDETASQTTKRFDSRTNATPSTQPKLTITFTPGSTMGACCFTNGLCQLVSSASCATAGGTFQGNGTICTPNPCPQPPGACCLPNGSCSVLTQAACTTAQGTWNGPSTPCTPTLCPLVLTPFVDELPLLPVMQPTTGSVGGEATYNVPITEFNQQLHRDLPPTRVWGYAGTYPGPTFECTSGAPITVNWINDLRDAGNVLRTQHYLPVDLCMAGPDVQGPTPRTVTHLFGGHVPANADGHPEATILPGQQVSMVYPNNQNSGTLWYHDNALGIARLNNFMGLAGCYIIRDAFEQGLNLPSGEFDVPLIIQDREFNHDGTPKYPADWQDHFHGKFVLVNGKVWPFMNVKRGKYRFRIVNASNSRVFAFTLSTLQPFTQIGTDQGLMPSSVLLSQLTVTPGERADVVIDFGGLTAGTQVLMNNGAPAPYPGEPGVGVVQNVMKFVVQSATGHTATIPTTLRPIVTLPTSQAAKTRTLELQLSPDTCTTFAWLINGKRFDEIDDFPRISTNEVWRFINRSDVMHPIHMHLVKFQVLDRQGFDIVDNQVVPSGPVFPRDTNETGWKDTVRTMPGQITRVIARFEDYPGRYPYHSAIMEQQDHEMQRQFEAKTPCLGDMAPAGNFDGTVNVDDLLVIINSWGPCVPSPCRADVAPPGGNGLVNIDDLLTVINGWGPCP